MNNITPEQRRLAGPFTRLARAMSKNFNVTVIPDGARCCTDGETIYIPFTADYLDEKNRQVLHGLLDHEISHVSEERTHRTAGEVTCMDVMRRKDLKNAEKFFFNAFEDVRIEQKYSKIYPGVAENLRAANQHSVTQFQAKHGKGDRSAWGDVLCAVIMKAQGYDHSWLKPELVPYLDKLQPEIDDCVKMAWAKDALELAQRAYRKIKELVEEKEKEEEEEGKGEGKEEGDGEEGEASKGGKPSKDEKKGKPKKAKLSKEEKEVLEQLGTDCEDTDLTDSLKGEMQGVVEKDAIANGRYIPHPDCSREDKFVPCADDAGVIYRQAREEILSQVGALRSKQLARLQIMMRRKVVSAQEEGEIDENDLPRVRTGAQDVFTNVTRGKRLDTAIEVLIDVSGSMGPAMMTESPFGVYRPEFRAPAYYALRTAIALAESWSSLRVCFEMIGFTSNSRRWSLHPTAGTSAYVQRPPFDYYLFKGWNEHLRACQGRFASLRGHCENIDGEALWMSAQRVAARPEKRKMLIVISDGQPACGGVDNRVNLHDHLKEVAGKVERSGIELIAIGAGTDAPRQFYKNHIVIKDLNLMATTVFKALDDSLRRSVA
jgi:cobalamin biosynthesis protein CobT